ncbi:hypothetical protein Ddc_14254 [Ditylenchus destructor]|nr:hypothetical protein Ddc_14254 [Ditylenchus destructor]
MCILINTGFQITPERLASVMEMNQVDTRFTLRSAFEALIRACSNLFLQIANVDAMRKVLLFYDQCKMNSPELHIQNPNTDSAPPERDNSNDPIETVIENQRVYEVNTVEPISAIQMKNVVMPSAPTEEILDTVFPSAPMDEIDDTNEPCSSGQSSRRRIAESQ